MAVPHGSMTFVKPDTMNVQARISRQTLASSLKALDFRIGFEYWCQLGTYFSKNTLRESIAPAGSLQSTTRSAGSLAAASRYTLRTACCKGERRLVDVLSALQVLAVVALAQFGEFALGKGERHVEEQGHVGTRQAVMTEFEV